jgi:UDP-N-acetylmuramate dehydrogenase
MRYLAYNEGMKIQDNVSLSDHSTMRLGGSAAHLCEITSREELSEAVKWAQERKLSMIMIGTGSNIVWGDGGFVGLVIVNRLKRYETFKETDDNIYITVGSGENWDSVVKRTVEAGLTGIEALSLIPGTAGATPIQNVGAYGQEIAQTLVSVEAYDLQSHSFVNIPKLDCRFGYRTSRFKTDDKHRFFITAVTLHLTENKPEPPFYAAVSEYLAERHITDFTPVNIRDAVIAIRSSKLPDPNIVANNGSFFANPVIDAAAFVQLQASFPDVIYWETEDGSFKLSAAWLIDHAGFKDVHDPETGMGTWPKQALVLINEHAKSTADLLKFKQKIVDKVSADFGVELEQEPELIGG